LRKRGFISDQSREGWDRFEIVECTACGVSFSDPLPSPADIETLYDDASAYSNVYGALDWPWQRRQHELDLRRVEKTRRDRRGRLLDVGCSYGLLLEVARERGWDVSGVEPSPEAAAVARKRAGADRVWTGYVEDLPNPAEGFDAISMSHVFEHLVDFRPVLAKLAGMLRAGGVLAIQAPQRRSLTTLRRGPDHRPIEHPFYWTYKGLAGELRRAGLDPQIAPPLWRGKSASEWVKDGMLATERALCSNRRFGLKSTLELHGRKLSYVAGTR